MECWLPVTILLVVQLGFVVISYPVYPNAIARVTTFLSTQNITDLVNQESSRWLKVSMWNTSIFFLESRTLKLDWRPRMCQWSVIFPHVNVGLPEPVRLSLPLTNTERQLERWQVSIKNLNPITSRVVRSRRAWSTVTKLQQVGTHLETLTWTACQWALIQLFCNGRNWARLIYLPFLSVLSLSTWTDNKADGSAFRASGSNFVGFISGSSVYQYVLFASTERQK